MAVPAAVAAAGWAPLVVALAAALAFSAAFVLWHRSVRAGESHALSTTVATLGLTVTLLSSVLVPVDVFLVSMSKFHNGTYRHWAAEASERIAISKAVEMAYVSAAALVLLLAFIIVPFVTFYRLGRQWGGPDRRENDDGKLIVNTAYRMRSCLTTFGNVFQSLSCHAAVEPSSGPC